MTTPKKKPVNSRSKGKRGELELAKRLTELGHPARRGVQFKGGEESPDVVCPSLEGFHIECKLTATCQMFSPAQLMAWDAQARADAGAWKTPIVIHRWNGARQWWVRVLTQERCPVWQTLEDFIADRHTWAGVKGEAGE